LIDAGKGDVALLLQTLAQTTPNQNSYSVLGRMATLAPFTQMDGAAGMAMGAFIDQPMNVKQSIQWTRSAFTALRDSVTPNSITATEFLAVQAQPRGLSHGTLFYTARLLEVPSNAAATDLDLGTVQFANPFPASWGVAAFANLFVARTYAASASQPMTAYGEVWSEDEANAFFSKPVAPTLSPPSKPLVDGMDAFQDQMVATPFTITWQPPTLGTPTTYELILYHLISKQGVTSSQYVAEIHTIPSVTSITVPAELLINGERYYFMLAAENRAGVDAATQPLRRSYPRGGGELLSGTLTVSP